MPIRKVKKMLPTENDVECKLCLLKNNEINKLNKQLVDIEAKIEKKVKKEYTEEEKAEAKKRIDEKKLKRDSKEKEYEELKEQNKKLKNELLTKFGITI